jgi:hypothetical protein
VFFDDILIYKRTWEKHLKHVDEILTIMEEQSLFSKEEKCEFKLTKILYLGHMIGVEGVKVYQENIYTILYYPVPRPLIDLPGFFEICSYCRRFVKEFSQLAAPLKDLTKKGEFLWSEDEHVSFNRMKRVMSTFPVLKLLDFTQPFVLECDTSNEGI